MTILFDIGVLILAPLVETKLLYILFFFFFSKWECAWKVNDTIIHKILGIIIIIIFVFPMFGLFIQ